MRTCATWNDLGLLESQGYPQKTGVGAARAVSNTTTNGFLTKVTQNSTNVASSITYHPNGMINVVTHKNSITATTTDTYAKDPTSRGKGGRRDAGCRAVDWSRGGRLEAE